MTDAENADMIEYWSGPTGQKWARYQEYMDASLMPLGQRAMAAAAPMAGERVIDIGCGCGDTTLELARRLVPGGFVLGVDVSPPMLERARTRAKSTDVPPSTVAFLCADAQVHAFENAVFDLVYSRFGVMFFADPVVAFGNLRSAMKPGGRLAFVCWRPMKESTWFSVPLAIVGAHVPLPEPSSPDEPGPFAFAEAARVRRILSGAGFNDTEIEKCDLPFTLAGGRNLTEAVDLLMQIGPTARAVAEAKADDALKARIAESLRTGLAPYETPAGIVLGAAAWIVTARAP